MEVANSRSHLVPIHHPSLSVCVSIRGTSLFNLHCNFKIFHFNRTDSSRTFSPCFSHRTPICSSFRSPSSLRPPSCSSLSSSLEIVLLTSLLTSLLTPLLTLFLTLLLTLLLPSLLTLLFTLLLTILLTLLSSLCYPHFAIICLTISLCISNPPPHTLPSHILPRTPLFSPTTTIRAGTHSPHAPAPHTHTQTYPRIHTHHTYKMHATHALSRSPPLSSSRSLSMRVYVSPLAVDSMPRNDIVSPDSPFSSRMRSWWLAAAAAASRAARCFRR
jgi:hypothetical protein